MESICYRFPIRPGKTAEVEAFCRSLHARSNEVGEALTRAGLASQAAVVVPTPERDYLVIYSQGSDLQASRLERLKSELAIDLEMWEVFDRTLFNEQGASLPVLAEWYSA